jgi:hypothetical protein
VIWMILAFALAQDDTGQQSVSEQIDSTTEKADRLLEALRAVVAEEPKPEPAPPVEGPMPEDPEEQDPVPSCEGDTGCIAAEES